MNLLQRDLTFSSLSNVNIRVHQYKYLIALILMNKILSNNINKNDYLPRIFFFQIQLRRN